MEAVFGLVGVLLGGFITAGVQLKLAARNTKEERERWARDHCVRLAQELFEAVGRRESIRNARMPIGEVVREINSTLYGDSERAIELREAEHSVRATLGMIELVAIDDVFEAAAQYERTPDEYHRHSLVSAVRREFIAGAKEEQDAIDQRLQDQVDTTRRVHERQQRAGGNGETPEEAGPADAGQTPGEPPQRP